MKYSTQITSPFVLELSCYYGKLADSHSSLMRTEKYTKWLRALCTSMEAEREQLSNSKAFSAVDPRTEALGWKENRHLPFADHTVSDYKPIGL